jgi:hypothetical protein
MHRIGREMRFEGVLRRHGDCRDVCRRVML